MTVSEFAKSPLFQKSMQILDQSERRVLSDEDRDLFLALLNGPAGPNEPLRTAAAEFKEAVRSGTLIP
jgi:uncharacterized protein (DUF1778 family)